MQIGKKLYKGKSRPGKLFILFSTLAVLFDIMGILVIISRMQNPTNLFLDGIIVIGFIFGDIIFSYGFILHPLLDCLIIYEEGIYYRSPFMYKTIKRENIQYIGLRETIGTGYPSFAKLLYLEIILNNGENFNKNISFVMRDFDKLRILIKETFYD